MPAQLDTLFISDLHLNPEQPLPVALFHRFMDEIAPAARALYILGDFFDAWVGDDDLALPFHADTAAALKRHAERGLGIHFMPGNRDFLAGAALARAAGWTVLPDPQVIDLYGTPTLLSHGDAYCTDDLPYQAFRRQVRDPSWQQRFLQQALETRRAQARHIRQQSEQAKAGKQLDIMDVNPAAIERAFTQARVRSMIHGHTHRPARHTLSVEGHTVTRWVLPDWNASGGYLACSAHGCALHTFP